MIKVVFISVLILTTETPSQRWLQWSAHYKDVEVCKKKSMKTLIKYLPPLKAIWEKNLYQF